MNNNNNNNNNNIMMTHDNEEMNELIMYGLMCAHKHKLILYITVTNWTAQVNNRVYSSDSQKFAYKNFGCQTITNTYTYTVIIILLL